MTRRRFAFWVGMGLFGVAERLGATELDALAAKLMEAADEPAIDLPPSPPPPPPAPAEMPVHWQATHNRTWRWVQREEYVDGEWHLTGMTTPVRRDSGEPIEDATGYLDDEAVPEAYRTAFEDLLDANGDPAIHGEDEGIAATEDEPGPEAASHRKARHGRPPSRWLRTLNAAELSVWLATVTPPEAGVHGMTFLEHLTRDHLFDADRLAGLTDAEMEKLHAAAHHGY
ncbi:MAG: hypothetical protein AAF266_12655 [Planctomycetota bacterium]